LQVALSFVRPGGWVLGSKFFTHRTLGRIRGLAVLGESGTTRVLMASARGTGMSSMAVEAVGRRSVSWGSNSSRRCC
jgi:hypothetical protein